MLPDRWPLGAALLLTITAAATACGSSDSASGGQAGEAAGGADGGRDELEGDSAGGAGGTDDCGCLDSETCCDGLCVDLSSDADNCGECGATCSATHASGSCSLGACVVDSCEDGFVDCNREPVDGCEAKDEGLPVAPRLLSPPIGHNTGSALSDSARMPELRWTAATGSAGSCGAVTYQVQLDDSCEVGQACDFGSPELDAAGIAELRYRPETPLAVATSVPVGTRYFWRVRACETHGRCSDWTAARYLNVGRLNDDLNGDGYSDLFAISYDSDSANHLHLHPGPLPAASDASNGKLRPTLNLSGSLGYYGAARFLGDVNGDGFADAIRSADYSAELLLGNADFEKLVTVQLASDFNGTHGVAGLGDWNGDGFADFAISDSSTGDEPPSLVHLYAGNAEALWVPTILDAPAGTTVSSFGTTLEGGLDFDGDGYTDLFILDGDEGRIHFVAGGSKPASKVKASLSTGATCDYYLKPNLVRAGDLNGDGYEDLAARCDGRLAVFAGGRTPELEPLWQHQFSDKAKPLGHGIVGGQDLGSDGFADLLVHGDDATGQNLFMLAGSATLSSADALVPFGGALSKDGKSLAGEGLSSGDFDADGRPDLLVQVKGAAELRLFSGGSVMPGSCALAAEAASKLGDWCRSAVTTIEGKYETEPDPDYLIGSSFGSVLAQ